MNPIKPRAYKVTGRIPDHARGGGITPGCFVFKCVKYDYGTAKAASEVFGEWHIAVTLKDDGDYPFVTMPLSSLSAIEWSVVEEEQRVQKQITSAMEKTNDK